MLVIQTDNVGMLKVMEHLEIAGLFSVDFELFALGIEKLLNAKIKFLELSKRDSIN
jgi:hypothetical protein